MPASLSATVSPALASGSSDAAAAADDASLSSAVATLPRGMRRVASAPAFKHASAYQGPCAAVAAAQADAAAEAAAAAAAAAPSSSSSVSMSSASAAGSKRSGWLFGGWSSRSSRNEKQAAVRASSCSTCKGGRCNCLEVYVVSRAFTEFGGDVIKRMPQEARDHMIDMGLCHYMTVFRTPDGQLVQFDFGPLGGDVQKAHGPIGTFLKRAHAAALAQAGQQQQQQQQFLQLAAAGAGAGSSAVASSSGDDGAGSSRGMVHSPSAPMLLPLASMDLSGAAGEAAGAAMRGEVMAAPQRRKKGVSGEIREKELAVLPPASMYMGRTQLSLADIRRYNSAQSSMMYTLHDNDCRHYVNSLVQYATGVERSTQHLKRHYFQSRHVDKWLWYGWFISATQFVTDVGNWGHVQAGAAATLLAVTGRSTLAQLKTLALPVMPALTRTLPSLIPTAAAGAAATGAAAGSSSAAGGLATSLKLPAALLLKRPLASSAVAAAGGAGAAAAAIRTVPDAAAAGGSGGGSA
eukprot:jgi/Sobl393_1/13051/SZX69798.1